MCSFLLWYILQGCMVPYESNINELTGIGYEGLALITMALSWLNKLCVWTQRQGLQPHWIGIEQCYPWGWENLSSSILKAMFYELKRTLSDFIAFFLSDRDSAAWSCALHRSISAQLSAGGVVRKRVDAFACKSACAYITKCGNPIIFSHTACFTSKMARKSV